MKVTGTEIAYYHICKTKLWLFSNHIQLEDEHGNVHIGKEIDESTYNRNTRTISLPGKMQVDFVEGTDGELILNEVKKSKKLENAHIAQIKYYLYLLEQKGLNVRGKLRYPEHRETKAIVLSDEDKHNIERWLQNIKDLVSQNMPEPTKKPYCKNCAYYDFCWV